MKCEDALVLMNAVLDGEAGPDGDQILRFHLNGCPECRKAMLINRSISEGIKELQEPEPSADLLDSVLARLENGSYDNSPLGRRSSRFMGYWKIAAAIPFAAAALLLFHGGESGKDQPSLAEHPSMVSEETVNYTPAPVMAYSRPSSVTTF